MIGLSGGERRRCALAELLLHEHDLLVLDEPTNHLDVEAVAWLAEHLVSLLVGPGRGHARPVVPRRGVRAHLGGARRRCVDAYEGGYAAYVLAKAERRAPGRRDRGPPAQPRPQGARLAAARPARADVQAASSGSTPPRPDRRRAAAARPARAPALRDAAARQGRHRRRGRRPGARRPVAAVARDLAARPRATGWGSSG